jgi:hypothetical protein
MQAYDFAGRLRLRPLNNIKFDELRHTIKSARLAAASNVSLLKPTLEWETFEKIKARIRYLELGAVTPSKKPFLIGWQRLTAFRKLVTMFVKLYGLTSNGMNNYSCMVGRRGVKHRSLRHNLVAGLGNHRFNQFAGSPHVRFEGTSLYQGEWEGIPLVTSLRPHGLGTIIFYDAWGFSKETKVIKLLVVCCRRLQAADVTTSDPFCEISCNGKKLQTSVKWTNLDPVWNEKFDIDVTNIDAGLSIVVKDKDYIGSDDFLGQVLIDLHELADGKRVRKIYQLRGEDLTKDETFDRGEIELHMQWIDRVYDEDISNMASEVKGAIKLQAWARAIAARLQYNIMKADYANKMLLVRKSAVQITNTCRIRLSRKELKRRLRRWKAALKIQKRVRIRIAKNIYKRLSIKKVMATKIQRIARGYNARNLLVKLRKERKILLNASASKIQRIARKMVAKIVVARMKAEREQIKKDRIHQLLKKLNNDEESLASMNSYDKLDDGSLDGSESISVVSVKEKKTTSGNKAKDEGSVSSEPKNNSVSSANKKSAKSNKTESKGDSDNKSQRSNTSKKGDNRSVASSKSGAKSTGKKGDIDTKSVESIEDTSVITNPQGGLTLEETMELNALMDDTKEPVEKWIKTYGIDPDYHLKRNRRITERVFNKILTIRYIRIVTVKYGVVFLNSYPPPMTLEEEMSDEPLRKREDFLCAFFPSCVPKYLTRKDVLEMVGAVPREGFLHIPTSINKRATVNYAVVMIQCLARQYIANNAKKFLIKIHEAIAKFQRIFRRKNQRQHHMAYIIQAMFYYKIANRTVKIVRLERKSAIMIQCAYRMWLAKIAEMNHRSVPNVRVLKVSSQAPLQGPEYCFDMKGSTFWVAESITIAEVRVELPVKEAIDGVWVMTSTYEACPRYVSIGVVLDKLSKNYHMLYTKVPLPRKKGLFWIPFRFKSKISKYWKLTFEGNYGDKRYISVRQIRFIRARECKSLYTSVNKL